MKLMMLAVTLIVAIGLGKAFYDFSTNLVINLAGVAVLAAGVLIWLAGRVSLGRFFTINPGLVRSHRLVKKGIYKYIRHPIYLGIFLIFIGLITSLSGFLTGAVLAAITIPAVIHDITTEEKFLSKKLKNYKKYCKKTKRLIPFVW